MKSTRLRTLIKDCVPPIAIRLSLRILGRDSRVQAGDQDGGIVAKSHYDKHFNIDWHKTNFNRIAVINLLCAGEQVENYLEIGCDANDCFDAVIARNKLGVDPKRGGTHRLTSNQFFAECGSRKFDIIFIDGDHAYEQVRRDVINSLRHITVGGWIVLHDLFPRNWQEEHLPQISRCCLGDVWKLGFELARCRDIDFAILKIDHGVGVIHVRKENPDIPDLHGELKTESFRYFYENAQRLPILEYEPGRDWIERRLRISQNNSR
jgi:hypothetical protein